MSKMQEILAFYCFLLIAFSSVSGDKLSSFTHIHIKEGNEGDAGHVLNCKVTRLGTEFTGNIDKTASGKICMQWSQVQLEKNEMFDVNFADGSSTAASNFCRNPDGDRKGPWCFAEGSKTKESCGISFCSQAKCRLTGVGEGLDFNESRSIYGEPCLPWDDPHDLRGKRSCANPTRNISGPWCHVQGGRKHLCEIPICDFPACSRVVKPGLGFSHFVALRPKMILRLKSWDASFTNATQGVKILLSTIPHLDGNSGFLVSIQPGPLGGGLTLRRWPLQKEEPWHAERHSYTTSVSGIKWNELTIESDEKGITISEKGVEKKLSLELKNEERLRFYSLGGLMAMWNSDSCCEEHVTTDMNFTQSWPLLRSEDGRFQFNFSARAFHSVVLKLQIGLDDVFGHYLVVLDRNLTDMLVWSEGGHAIERVVRRKQFPLFKDFRVWHQFVISVFGNKLTLLWENENRKEAIKLLEFSNENISGLRWLSIGSNRTLMHWMINCKPKEITVDPLLSKAQCLRDSIGFSYAGSQAASSMGVPCLPWTHPRVDEALQSPFLFPEGSVTAAANYCRNPNRQREGPWCFTVQPGHPAKPCSIPDCAAENCRFAGTGNDYMGSMNTTISNRTCQKWSENYPHVIDWDELLKDQYFTERSIKNDSNYCRNPSRDIIGSYCFTTDPKIRVDACYVPSCRIDYPESQTVVLKGLPREGRTAFVIPKWRWDGIRFSVKQWDPLGSDGLRMTLRPFKGDTSVKVVIGAERNTLVHVTYLSPQTGEMLIFKRHVPHMVGVADWTSFVLRIDETKVELGYAEHPYPFLKWRAHKSDFPLFSPVHFSVGSEHGNQIGLNMDIDDCLTFHEDVKEGRFYEIADHAHQFFHVNQWTKNTNLANHRQLQLNIRGSDKGEFGLALSSLGDFANGYDLIHFAEYSIEFGRVTSENEMISYTQQNFSTMVIPSLHFRKFFIRFSENKLEIVSDDATINFHWSHLHGEKNLWYIFTTEVRGRVIWSVNCKPQDVDHIQDGGWSEWADWRCSAPCNGGRGFRTRTCTAPPPSLLGRFCEGEAKMAGACNEFRCGTVSPATRRKIRKYFNSEAHWFTLEDGQELKMKCEVPFLNVTLRELHLEDQNVTLDWAKDGVLLPLGKNTTEFGLAKVNRSHAGVYTLQALRRRDVSSAVPVCFFTLAVRQKVQVRADETLTLDAHVGELALLYKTLLLQWLRENVVVRRLSVNPELQKHELRVRMVDANKHGGDWKCIVVQPDLGLNWTTAWYSVKVLPARTLGLTLAEGPILSIIFKPVMDRFGEAMVVPFFTLFLVGLCASVCLSTRLYLRWQRRRRRRRSPQL